MSGNPCADACAENPTHVATIASAFANGLNAYFFEWRIPLERSLAAVPKNALAIAYLMILKLPAFSCDQGGLSQCADGS
jgi:hypothetical protein